MSETFCGVCRHPTPGHEPGCPVQTGEPQRGLHWQAHGIPGYPVSHYSLVPIQAQSYGDQQQMASQMASQGPAYHEQPGSPAELIARMRLLCDQLEKQLAWVQSQDKTK